MASCQEIYVSFMRFIKKNYFEWEWIRVGTFSCHENNLFKSCKTFSSSVSFVLLNLLWFAFFFLYNILRRKNNSKKKKVYILYKDKKQFTEIHLEFSNLYFEFMKHTKKYKKSLFNLRATLIYWADIKMRFSFFDISVNKNQKN